MGTGAHRTGPRRPHRRPRARQLPRAPRAARLERRLAITASNSGCCERRQRQFAALPRAGHAARLPSSPLARSRSGSRAWPIRGFAGRGSSCRGGRDDHVVPRPLGPVRRSPPRVPRGNRSARGRAANEPAALVAMYIDSPFKVGVQRTARGDHRWCGCRISKLRVAPSAFPVAPAGSSDAIAGPGDRHGSVRRGRRRAARPATTPRGDDPGSRAPGRLALASRELSAQCASPPPRGVLRAARLSSPTRSPASRCV